MSGFSSENPPSPLPCRRNLHFLPARYLRLREEEVRRGRVPYGCSHGVGRVRAGLRREAFHMCDSRHLILAEIHIELPLAEELLKLAQ